MSRKRKRKKHSYSTKQKISRALKNKKRQVAKVASGPTRYVKERAELGKKKAKLKNELLKEEIVDRKRDRFWKNVGVAGQAAQSLSNLVKPVAGLAGLGALGVVGYKGYKGFKKSIPTPVEDIKNITGQVVQKTQDAYTENVVAPINKAGEKLKNKANEDIQKRNNFLQRVKNRAEKDKALRKKWLGFSHQELHDYLDFRASQGSNIEFKKRTSAATKSKISKSLKEYHRTKTKKNSSQTSVDVVKQEQRRKNFTTAVRGLSTLATGAATLSKARDLRKLTDLKLGQENTRAWIGTGLNTALTGSVIGGGIYQIKSKGKYNRDDFLIKRRRNRLKAQANRNEMARIKLSAKKRKVDAAGLF
jgi:hypothetical protein